MFQSLLGRRSASGNKIKQMNVGDLWEELQNGNAPILVDVRSAQEFDVDGHIAGARLLPLQVLMSRYQELPKDQPIVCVCRSGNRSQVACEQLAGLGYENLANLSGGMISWKSSGLPYE